MTVAVAPISGEVVLNLVDAQRLTASIRAWVNAYPLEDVKAAYFGRIWLAMGYESWSEWCDCELDGFKLPAVERREVVAELAREGMSNVAIGDVIGVSDMTVGRDLAASTNVEPDRKVTGQDGKTYSKPKPKPKPRKEPEPPTPMDEADYLNLIITALSHHRTKLLSQRGKELLLGVLQQTIREVDR